MWFWIIFFIAIVFWYITRLSKESRASPTRRPIPANVYTWPELGEFDFDIVGESHYRSNLRKIAGEHGPDGPDVIFTAYIVPEDNNEFDDKAVRVDAEGMTIGYFDRDAARSFRRRLGAQKLTGQTTSCKATLKGGHLLDNGRKAHYGVLLDIENFD